MSEAIQPTSAQNGPATLHSSSDNVFLKSPSKLNPIYTSPGHGQLQQSHNVQPADLHPQANALSTVPATDDRLPSYAGLGLQQASQSLVSVGNTTEHGHGDLTSGIHPGLSKGNDQRMVNGPGDIHSDINPDPPQHARQEHKVGNGHVTANASILVTDGNVGRPSFNELKPHGHSDGKPLDFASQPIVDPTQSTQHKASSPERPNVDSKSATATPSLLSNDSSSGSVRDERRPRTSIPSYLEPEEYARECVVAALSSRLNPFGLHPDEYTLLRTHINHHQVTNYLNIRNGILRLWVRNPSVNVTREEAAGCSRDYRWFSVADVSYQWLVRRGYINFGCVDIPDAGSLVHVPPTSNTKLNRKTVVVIGAGMAGLGCARQLENLFAHFSEHWTLRGEVPPKVVIVEGRARIGGRVYSHPLHTQATDSLPPDLRCAADMGAQIITGFDQGNPLSAVIRGQLGLHFHLLKDNSILHDSNGSVVDKDRDQLVEKLYNDILDRASVYRHKTPATHTVDGDKDLIETGRDPAAESGKTISDLEDAAAPLPPTGSGAESTRRDSMEQVPAGVDKLTGKLHMAPGPSSKGSAVQAVGAMGWQLRSDVASDTSFNLDAKATSVQHPSLGSIMDDAVRQYQGILELTPQDMRLLNWHYANLEYANAANVDRLSLGGWDQDIGNEFEGEHAQIIGGYLQVPRGLSQNPSPLDIRTHSVVKRLDYFLDSLATSQTGKVVCEDGESIEADTIVTTLPLGVLKAQSVVFEPPLPSWKSGCIDRLGFGTLNKVVLVYKEAFWDKERDMFGLLRDPLDPTSLKQEDYAQHRGRFYLFWNCLKTSGRPMLVALMAGDAAHQTEASEDADLALEATKVLGKMFAVQVPKPLEVIVTRWAKDRFAKGSYSYVGTEARPDDYELMAKPVGNLYFAGEATCGTHPATVHGAYLSGLRAAAEVVESMLGPIKVPTPLLPPKIQVENKTTLLGSKRKAEDLEAHKAVNEKRSRLEAYEAEVNMAILKRLGERPTKPGKSGANPFLLYQKDKWHICKAKCDEARKQATKNPEAKATRNEVRAALGQMWREAPEEEKRPYLEQTSSNKQLNVANVADYNAKLAQWDKEAALIRARYLEEHANTVSQQETRSPDESGAGRKAKKRSSYAEESEMDLAWQ